MNIGPKRLIDWAILYSDNFRLTLYTAQIIWHVDLPTYSSLSCYIQTSPSENMVIHSKRMKQEKGKHHHDRRPKKPISLVQLMKTITSKTEQKQRYSCIPFLLLIFCFTVVSYIVVIEPPFSHPV